MFKFLLYIPLFFLCLSVLAQSDVSPDFTKGINSYKQKNYKEAKQHFEKAQLENPDNVSNLYNLGLTQLKLGKPGVSAALWKKVLNLQPHHQQARNSLKSILKKLPNSNTRSSWEKFRSYGLGYFSINHLLFFFTLFFAGGAATCIKYFTRRHIALKNHFQMPHMPKLSWFFIICFVVVSVLFTAKLYDHSKPRATVVADSAALFLSPTEEDIKISELDQGTEIIINSVMQKWARVITLSGNEGWVKSETILQTSGSGRL